MKKQEVFKGFWWITFPGFYSTVFGTDHLSEYDIADYYGCDEEALPEDVWECFDYDKYRDDVARDLVSAFVGLLNETFEGLLSVEDDEIAVDSPREYNFYNDNLMSNLVIADYKRFKQILGRWIAKHKDYVAKRLKRDFAPRSGFIPFYEADFDRFMVELHDFQDVTTLAILLRYVLELYAWNGNEEALFEFGMDEWLLEETEARPEDYFNIKIRESV